MKISFLTYYTRDEPFLSMAKRLNDTAMEHHPDCNFRRISWDKPGHGREFFAESMGELYSAFSDLLVGGPVALIDADCYFQGSIIPAIESETSDADWDIAAVHRGKVGNSYGDHSFLSTIVIFNNRNPHLARMFWFSWAAAIYDFVVNPRPEPKKCARPRNEKFSKLGWSQTWFADQASLNRLLGEHSPFVGLRVLKLPRELFAAKPGTKDALIIHEKGLK